MKRTFLWLSGFLISITSVAQAELTATNNSAVPANQTILAPLISFVLTKGKPDFAETYIVQNLNLGSKDLAVIETGWKSRGDNTSHLVSISTENKDDVMIFIFNEKIDGICWLTSKSGQIRSTVEFSRSSHTSHATSNELHLKEFEREKKYLLGRISAARGKKQ
jgi:hypothetical protein